MPKPSDAGLRSLAGQKGYTPERALMQGCWRLKGKDGALAKNTLTNATAFTIYEAMAFLKEQPD